MLHLWLLIIAVLLVQEFATTAIVLVLALQNNLTLWPIHVIWICLTLLDMYVGFTLATLMRQRFQKTWLVKKVDGWADKLKKALGEHGDKISLTVIGFFDFPYLNAFLAAWLDIPMPAAFGLTFIGNLVWYCTVWATVLGTTSFIKNPSVIAIILIGIGILSHLIFNVWDKKMNHKRN